MSSNVSLLTTPNSTGETEGVLLGRRIVVGLGLATTAAIHLLDLPGKIEETPYLGVAYILLIVAALVIAERVFTNGTQIDFVAAALLSFSALLAFTVNRTVGMPYATGDIGNWLEPLGLLSLAVEGFVLWQATAAIVMIRRGATISAH